MIRFDLCISIWDDWFNNLSHFAEKSAFQWRMALNTQIKKIQIFEGNKFFVKFNYSENVFNVSAKKRQLLHHRQCITGAGISCHTRITNQCSVHLKGKLHLLICVVVVVISQSSRISSGRVHNFSINKFAKQHKFFLIIKTRCRHQSRQLNWSECKRIWLKT